MNKVSIIFMLLLLTSIKSISQNATVVYQGSSLSNINNCPQCCNVFNQSGNNPTVGGLNHFPVSGGAIFDGTSIKMQTQVNSQSLPAQFPDLNKPKVFFYCVARDIYRFSDCLQCYAITPKPDNLF